MAESDAGGGGLRSSSLVVCGSLVSRLFSRSKLMIAMLWSREQLLLEVPRRVEGMEGRGGSKQADRMGEEVVKWYVVMVVCRKELDG